MKRLSFSLAFLAFTVYGALLFGGAIGESDRSALATLTFCVGAVLGAKLTYEAILAAWRGRVWIDLPHRVAHPGQMVEGVLHLELRRPSEFERLTVALVAKLPPNDNGSGEEVHRTSIDLDVPLKASAGSFAHVFAVRVPTEFSLRPSGVDPAKVPPGSVVRSIERSTRSPTDPTLIWSLTAEAAMADVSLYAGQRVKVAPVAVR